MNIKYPYSTKGSTLLQKGITEMPTIVSPILPKVGVCAIAGESDSGKSSFLRALAMDIATGKDQFLGWQINATYNSVIYVSTEDDEFAISYLLYKQVGSSSHYEMYENLRFIFETDDILDKIEEELNTAPADIVIIDAFSDLYDGEINSSTKVRYYINKYSNIAKKFNCLVLYLHHTGKRTQNLAPSKDNLLGSQGFEAKMRLVMELRKDPSDNNYRHLCIVKGNYLESSYKNESYKLEFLSNMTFRNTGIRVPFENLVPNNTKTDILETYKPKAIELLSNNISKAKIYDLLKAEGLPIGRTKTYQWLNTLKSIRPDSQEV